MIKIGIEPSRTDSDSGIDTQNSDKIGIIADSLGVDRREISDIVPMKMGMTNHSFRFLHKGQTYIIRVPGEGTDHLIDREEEARICDLIQGTGICEDIVFVDSRTGIKITRFIEGARTCDPYNWDEVSLCMKKLREFHEMELHSDKKFDIFERIDFYESLWNGQASQYSDYCETKRNVVGLKAYIDAQNVKLILAHIDAVPDNFLLFSDGERGDQIRLIDWEYAGMQDPHVDVAMFCIYAMYDRACVDRLINIYFAGECPIRTRIKIYCYIAACGLLWSNWCEYKRDLGVEFGIYAEKQYQYAKDYYSIAARELKRWGYEQG